MVTISINDELQQFPARPALRELLQNFRAMSPDTAFAVAVNGEFVPRAQYEALVLADGDALDIVSPVGGG